jgi:DNA-binding CsgD family transcriptional regulator
MLEPKVAARERRAAMTLLVDAPPGYAETPGPDGTITCRSCGADVRSEPCPEHGPASTVDNRIDYEHLADLAQLVMSCRRATGIDFAIQVRKHLLNLNHVPLLGRWGVIGRDNSHGWLVRIHEAHSDLVRSAIVVHKGFPPPVSPLNYLAMPVLTTRQREVIELVAEGLGNKDIADRLHISLDTVKSHVAGSQRSTGATNRTNLVHIAHLRGVFGANPQPAATEA